MADEIRFTDSTTDISEENKAEREARKQERYEEIEARRIEMMEQRREARKQKESMNANQINTGHSSQNVEQIKINLNGTLYCCKNVLPIMKKQRYGKIVNLSSIAGKLGGANASVYSATKAGVLELTACLAREYAEYDININCVLPGIIRTPLWNQMLVEMTEENHADKDVVFKSYTDTIPMKRPQEPVDIANAILFLCTDEASNITAQNLGIDGGQTY